MPSRTRLLEVEAKGAREFRRELKAAGKEWPKQLTKVHKTIARAVQDRARARARGYGGVRRKAANAITARASAREAGIGVTLGTARYPFSAGAFFGADRYKQFPGWVGNNWEAGVYGQGPYAINEAVAGESDNILSSYGDMVTDLARRAFPD